ncbi:hypothetical protein CCMSSC00406_0010081 [Pleurotus cornucopiae]|uniref:Uncharacterized protein n=1 Tax=Pleurotus cornucopiae TaxID=5321 RepID=A0ACB7IIK6_PLECO|nr:hypothetical protein CCMSSC00406_0010081 [Pleurotus cornucopiae]
MPADVDAATTPAGPPRRVAIITGAARGIGQSIAARLVTDGLSVIVNDIASKSSELEAVVKQLNEQAISASPGDASNIVAHSVIGDVSKEEDVENMINQAVQAFGRLDVMVANAGIAGPNSTIMDAKVEEWEALLSVNLRGVLLCYKHAARQMVLARWLDYEETPNKVHTARPNPLYALSRRRWIYGVPNAKVAPPDVVASIVSYLVKPEAYFVTGQIVSVDGGLMGPMQ